MVFPLTNCTSELLEPKKCLDGAWKTNAHWMVPGRLMLIHVGLRGQCVISKVFD